MAGRKKAGASTSEPRITRGRAKAGVSVIESSTTESPGTSRPAIDEAGPAIKRRKTVNVTTRTREQKVPVQTASSSTAGSSASSIFHVEDEIYGEELDTPDTPISTESGNSRGKVLKQAIKRLDVVQDLSRTSITRRRSARVPQRSINGDGDDEEGEDVFEGDGGEESDKLESDIESEPEEFQPSEDDSDEYAGAEAENYTLRKGKGKGKARATASAPARSHLSRVVESEDDDNNDQDYDPDLNNAPNNLSRTEADSDDNEEDDDDGDDGDNNDDTAAVARPVAPMVPIRYVRQRRGIWRSRGERQMELLYFWHPELRTIWQDLDKREKIQIQQDPQPKGLTLTMLPFQLEGLHWLRNQEKTEFRGGILADEMGMGKTIQTIALLMAEPRQKPNLVVAPTVALMQWRNEIEKHTGNALSVILFHGANRPGDMKTLKNCDVIMTTYSVLESAYRKQQHGFKRKDGLVKDDSVLHQIKFHRVILDEAHNIKDRSCNTAKAVFALKTTYKLCLSGTPLQNRIGEFFSLLRFLEADPFCFYFCRKCPCKALHWKFKDNRTCDSCGHRPMDHCSWFNTELLKPIQQYGNSGDGKLAFEKLRKILSHIMLRRTKVEKADDLGLPPRIVRIRRDYFNEEELDLYDSIYGESRRKFDTYVAQGVVLNNYANIFTLITRMRQLADHPDLVLRKHAEEGQNTLVCCICDDEAEEAIASKCHHKFCRLCVSKYIESYDGDGSPDCPQCHVPLSIDLTQPAIEDFSNIKRGSIINRIDMNNWRSSTKIEALVEELYKLRSKTQTIKSIVFSQFTSMLQLVEWRLHRGGFKTVMLEGSMSPPQRDAVIRYFMENTSVEVFLVSLKAGGVALNLTEASQVFILDPWWNPSVEWQSGDRVHRIGQKRSCTITRLVVEDSIESRIIELQEKKARMIHATVNGDQKSMDKLTPADMQFLFQN